VWHNGIRWRKATVRTDGRSEFFGEIPVRRLRCGDCRQRWSHAPDAVVAQGHYQPCVVAEAVARDVLDGETTVTAVAREHGCHRRTLGRWTERVAAVAEPSELARQLLVESAAPVVPAPPPVTRPRRSTRLAALGVRAVWVLALLEALASLRGLSPPGLAHAAALVPALAPPSLRRGGAVSGK
jgi:transposase-like protein